MKLKEIEGKMKKERSSKLKIYYLTSSLTASTFSACLLNMCFLTKSGPLNFFPLSGHSHLSLASSWVLASTNFSISVKTVKKKIFVKQQWKLYKINQEMSFDIQQQIAAQSTNIPSHIFTVR